MQERVTVVKTTCRACGSNEVRSTFTGTMVIRECNNCETRIGSYEVKSAPKWAKGES